MRRILLNAERTAVNGGWKAPILLLIFCIGLAAAILGMKHACKRGKGEGAS